jgi:toxin ParE1/3/4
LREFIELDDPTAARRTALRIVAAVETLIPANPKVGRPGRVSGTRELVIARTPFIVPYRLREGTIEVLRVFHGARRWPDRL